MHSEGTVLGLSACFLSHIANINLFMSNTKLFIEYSRSKNNVFNAPLLVLGPTVLYITEPTHKKK